MDSEAKMYDSSTQNLHPQQQIFPPLSEKENYLLEPLDEIDVITQNPLASRPLVATLQKVAK